MVMQQGGTLGGQITFNSVYNQNVQITGYTQIPRKMVKVTMCWSTGSDDQK